MKFLNPFKILLPYIGALMGLIVASFNAIRYNHSPLWLLPLIGFLIGWLAHWTVYSKRNLNQKKSRAERRWEEMERRKENKK